MEGIMCDNNIFINGVVTVDPIENLIIKNQQFSSFFVRVFKKVDVFDVIKVLAPTKVCERYNIVKDSIISLNGKVRSYRKEGKLMLNVLLTEVIECENVLTKDNNVVSMSGYVCKPPQRVRQGSGFVGASFMLAVQRNDGTNGIDYVPCLIKSDFDGLIRRMNYSDYLKFSGRFRRRVYPKLYENGKVEKLATENIMVRDIDEFLQ